jgi:glycosyltransferase involved in cell wall biosynthesis
MTGPSVNTDRPLISVVVPMFNEADNAAALAQRFEKLIRLHSNYHLELIAVDDGSTDGSPAALASKVNPESRVTIVELARNFGSHQAVSAGLDLANGACAIVLGADLQEPPELVGLFLSAWRDGSDVVWGVRHKRDQRGLATWFSRWFSRLFHRYSEIKTYPVEGPSGVLVSRIVLDKLAELHERNRNVYGLIAWLGFPSTQVRYNQQPRNAGVTKWTRGRLARLAMDSFVEFSSVPLKAATLAGATIATVGFLYAIVLAMRAFLVGTAPEGWTTVTVLVLVLGGIQLLMIGVVGEYLWRTTDEARQRPVYVIRRVRRLGQP